MAVVAKNHETGESIDLGRDCWFSAEAVALLERAVEKDGADKALALLLTMGLGLPLRLVGKLTGQTKNVVKTQVITARKSVRRRELRRQRQRSLFS